MGDGININIIYPYDDRTIVYLDYGDSHMNIKAYKLAWN